MTYFNLYHHMVKIHEKEQKIAAVLENDLNYSARCACAFCNIKRAVASGKDINKNSIELKLLPIMFESIKANPFVLQQTIEGILKVSREIIFEYTNNQKDYEQIVKLFIKTVFKLEDDKLKRQFNQNKRLRAIRGIVHQQPQTQK